MPRQAAHAAPHRPLGITLGHLVTMRDFPPKDDNGEAIYGHVVTRTTRTLAVRYIYVVLGTARVSTQHNQIKRDLDNYITR